MKKSKVACLTLSWRLKLNRTTHLERSHLLPTAISPSLGGALSVR